MPARCRVSIQQGTGLLLLIQAGTTQVLPGITTNEVGEQKREVTAGSRIDEPVNAQRAKAVRKETRSE
jgi:hypothetical protein